MQNDGENDTTMMLALEAGDDGDGEDEFDILPFFVIAI